MTSKSLRVKRSNSPGTIATRVMCVPTIIMRSATPADHATFAKLFLELRVDDPVMSAERFEAEMVKTTIIAEHDDGKAAGYAFFRPMAETSHLSHIVSAPHARRTGVGRALMAEVAKRSKALGCSMMSLNVLPTNTSAIALYESFGLVRSHVNRGFRVEWSAIDALPESATPYVSDVREVDPNDDDRLERETKLPKGMLADQRARPGRVIRMIEREGESSGGVALSIFDIAFPGAYPMRAPDAAHALSLLRAFRTHARPEDASFSIMIEDDDRGGKLAEALTACGAHLRHEMLSMRGAI